MPDVEHNYRKQNSKKLVKAQIKFYLVVFVTSIVFADKTHERSRQILTRRFQTDKLGNVRRVRGTLGSLPRFAGQRNPTVAGEGPCGVCVFCTLLTQVSGTNRAVQDSYVLLILVTVYRKLQIFK